MGHDSRNLLDEEYLSRYGGAILSPVNYVESSIRDQIMRAPASFETIFDPQLYYPQTLRGELRQWSYFPSDVDTADTSSVTWWEALVDRIVASCVSLRPSAACSPAIVPRSFTNEYYSGLVRSGSYLHERLAGTNIRSLQTLIVGLADLSVPRRGIEIASIASRTAASEVYLVISGDTLPRRELADTEGLKGARRLISALESTGLPVLVGFTSSDMVLWKAAGASSCATGKFFNLRRFTSSRFEDDGAGGGGQLPYWFEESLLAFLREPDIRRIRTRYPDMLSDNSLRNSFGLEIIESLDSGEGTPWLGTSWRQFMYAFADLEHRISQDTVQVRGFLRSAEQNWRSLDDASFFMDEMRNDGTWLRTWRIAEAEYRSH